jgi:hypothetical protein
MRAVTCEAILTMIKSFQQNHSIFSTGMKIILKLLVTYEKLLPPGTMGSTCEIKIPEGSQPLEVLKKYGVPVDETTVVLINGRTPSNKFYTLKEGDVLCAFPVAAGG